MHTHFTGNHIHCHIDRHKSCHPRVGESNTHSTHWMWSDNLFVQSARLSWCLCLVTHCNGIHHPSVCVCVCVREWEKKCGCEMERDREKERQIEEGSVRAWHACACLYVCVCERERYRVSQYAVSGLAVWADTDYSLHSSLPSQATIATAKALYFKKLQHSAGSRIASVPRARGQFGHRLPGTKFRSHAVKLLGTGKEYSNLMGPFFGAHKTVS